MQDTSCTHVILCKKTERMKAVYDAKMIKQTSRTCFSSASQIVLRLFCDPGENKQMDPSNPLIAPRGSVGGLHSIKANKVSFPKEVLPFKKR